MKARENRNSAPGIVSYIFIKNYKKETGKPPSGLFFNEFMVLFNKRMLDAGKDMKLSHCWYRWGDEVVRYYMPYLKWNHEDLGSTTVDWGDVAPVISDVAPFAKEAQDFFIGFMKEYGTEERYEKVYDDVYSFAPYEFQNRYRRVRDALKNAEANYVADNMVRGVFKPLFDSAMDTFPDDFKEIREKALLFRKIVDCAVENGTYPSGLRDMTETFWFFFCYHLRTKQCFNVSMETKRVWKEVLSVENESFSDELEILAEFYASNSNDPEIGRLVSKRRKHIENLNKIIDSLPDMDSKNVRHDIGRSRL